MDEELRRQIQDELTGKTDAQVQLQFMSSYECEIEDFLREMTLAFRRWKELDQVVTRDRNTMVVTAYAYGALHQHLLSMKLLVGGYFSASGNAERYVLECIATSILAASDPKLRELILEGKYTTTNSARRLLKRTTQLNLDRKAVERIVEGIKHYDQLSHPSMLALGTTSVTLDSSKLMLGVHFDPRKKKAYDFEVASRVGIASMLLSCFDAIQQVYVP
jgi:hypothetical protein